MMPGGQAADGDRPAGAPRFVVHKHDARRLHYDFRLEADGVLVSWAVPKGPSYDPGTKRLAVHVEDHPLDYRGFEGVIPGAQYGSGTVIIWDEGTYRNLTEHQGRPVEVVDAVRRGHVSVWLEGTKLQGGWSLTRTGGSGGKESWILVKRSDDHADPTLDIEASQPDSARTGRSLDEVGAEEGAAPASRPRAAWRAPMLAQLVTPDERPRLARSPGWSYERKLDGLRCVAVRNGGEVELWSRNHLSFNARFPEVVHALGRLGIDNFTMDGEIVAFDGDRTSFSRLQQPGSGGQAVYCVFDLLWLLGQDTTALPLTERRALLAESLAGAPELVTTVTAVEGGLDELLARACADGWEGLVAKQVSAPYRSGRSPDWRKHKCSASQELVIGGWTDPSGARSGFGALLVGYYDDGGLRYAGKVGTGFTQRTLHDLAAEMAARTSGASPFAGEVPVKRAHWVRPELVAAVEFTEWTRDGRLRHPSFEGLRPDKDPREVRREA
jgi:bifunctional non-homologous end joining protein LigD